MGSNMDEYYDALFEPLQDEEDIYYHKIIPTIDVNVLQKIVEQDIQIINDSNLSVQEWARYKWSLMQDAERWGLDVYNWGFKENKQYPYISIDINYDLLENKASRYFQVLMSLENAWFGDQRLVNQWEIIDEAHNK